MPFKKVVKGSNMYQDWITHTHTHLAGECLHKCSYCYVQRNLFGVIDRYQGAPRIIKSELNVNYGSGNVIFIEHMNDLFGPEIKIEWITDILKHCRKYENNTYVFQSKNPERAYIFRDEFPAGCIFGTTIETNRNTTEISRAPKPIDRFYGIKKLKDFGMNVFITIEPIMDFDVQVLAEWIINVRPNFVNIGADSKGCDLSEPSAGRILRLIDALEMNSIVIKKKTNLGRILKNIREE